MGPNTESSVYKVLEVTNYTIKEQFQSAVEIGSADMQIYRVEGYLKKDNDIYVSTN